MSLAVAALAAVVLWWLVCRWLPRIGALGSAVAIAAVIVAWLRSRSEPPPIDPVVSSELTQSLTTIVFVVPLLAACIGLVIAVTGWVEARREAAET